MSTQQPTLLVLAAGMGSRYGGLKQLDPIGPNGETMLDYAVYDAERAGFGKVVFVIREIFAEKFREQIGSRFEGRIAIAYAFQDLHDLPAGFSVPQGREKPWGTAHAVRSARKLIDTPFVVINADDFYGRDAYAQMAAHLRALNASADTLHLSMVGYPILNTLSEHGSVNRGVCVTQSGLLRSIDEVLDIRRDADGTLRGNNAGGARTALPEDCLVSMNFWGFTPALFEYLEAHFIAFLNERGSEQKSECYIPAVIDALIRDKGFDCPVLQTNASWFGVTYADDKPRVVEQIARLIAKGEYPGKQ